MINLSNNIIIIAEGDDLRRAVEQAINDAQRTLLSYYAPGQTKVSVKKITSTRNNSYKSLAFNRYVPTYQSGFDAAWIEKVFLMVHNHSRDEICSHHLTYLNGIGISENVPRTLAVELWRGFRVFLLALWCRKAVLLPMNFSLPSNSRGKEYASVLYTEVLAIYRLPFVSYQLAFPDISQSIAPRGRNNFNWYAWRPIIASDWHAVEDINSSDLIALFTELGNRRHAENNPEAPAYPLSPPSFLGPLAEKLSDRCNFNIGEIFIYSPCTRTPSMMLEEVKYLNLETGYKEIKNVWVKYQQRYLVHLKEIKKIKNSKCTEHDLGKLNQYLFSLLPQEGYQPPLPTEFGRKYMEGIGVPPLRQVIKKRDSISALERFFQYLQDIAPFEDDLAGLLNPILSLDKPRERKLRQTQKKTFRINDFKLFYNLIHAIGEFSWHVAKHIGEGTAPADWIKILNDRNKNLVLNTEDFGFVPTIRLSQIDGTPIQVNLRWLPIVVIPIKYVHLKYSQSQWAPIPDLHGIHQTITGVETGLRHIHIRWLDKRTFKKSPACLGLTSFDLLVNTDKVTYEWVRPTAIPVLTALERQIESQSWVAAGHFDTELFYDNHELSDFGKICPVFMKYDEAKVYSAQNMALFFRNLVYFFNQVKVGLCQPTIDQLPEEVSDIAFNSKKDFEWAMRCRHKFNTQYTPHGLRATVVSVHAPILPPHVIGEYITGHTSENMVKYYTVIDSDYIDDVKALNRQMIFGNDPRGKSILSIRAESKMSSLRNAVTVSPIADVLRDYGAFSFASEEANGKIKSGMNAILTAVQDDIVINPTHMCPFRNQCPPEIVSTIGAKACGQCHYSVKTVDHLTRILSHCRVLSRQYDHANNQLKNASNNGASEESLEALENNMVKIAGEIAAWGLTARVLAKNYEQLKGRVLVNKPEIIMKQFAESSQPDSELENLLIQCEEAAAYPELADSALLADVAMVRARILAMTGSIEEVFAPLDSYQMLDQFRGLLRGICIATGKSPKELVAHMEKPLGGTPGVLKALEKIYV